MRNLNRGAAFAAAACGGSPVKVTTPGKCIEWGGFTYLGYLNFCSGWEHCR